MGAVVVGAVVVGAVGLGSRAGMNQGSVGFVFS